jgi:predicted dehydrogenase
MSISLLMGDGSVGSINYFANGSKSFPKETIHIFSDNRVLKVDNFRRTEGYDFHGFRKFKTMRQEKGHRQQFALLSEAIEKGLPSLIPLTDLVNVTLASFAAVESARNEQTVQVPKGS